MGCLRSGCAVLLAILCGQAASAQAPAAPSAPPPPKRDCRGLPAVELRECYRANAASTSGSSADAPVGTDPLVPPAQAAEAEPPQHRSKAAMYAGIGMAAGGAAIAGLFGLTLAIQSGEAQKCAAAGSRCLNRAEIDFSMGAKTVGVIVGGAVAVTGLVLLIYGAPRVAPTQTTTLELRVTPGGLAIAGAF